MPDLATCIALFRAREATRPPGTPIRVIRAVTLTTAAWRSDERMHAGVSFANLPTRHAEGSLSETCRRLAVVGEGLGLERVGLVVETTTEVAS